MNKYFLMLPAAGLSSLTQLQEVNNFQLKFCAMRIVYRGEYPEVEVRYSREDVSFLKQMRDFFEFLQRKPMGQVVQYAPERYPRLHIAGNASLSCRILT